MRTKWIVKNQNSNLIIFFNGWGMDENPLRQIDWGQNDVLMVYDYSSILPLENLDEYRYKLVIAWSMGVMMASKILHKNPHLKINKSIAINGTLLPIDKKYGILPKIYDLTLNSFSEKTRDKFFNNMFQNGELSKIDLPSRELNSQKEELEFLKKMAETSPQQGLCFDLAIVSENDKIISTNNQLNFWETTNTPVYSINSGHYPFFQLEKNFYEEIQ